MTHPTAPPSLVYSDEDGRICDLSDLHAAGMSGGSYLRPALEDFIPLPEGSELFTLPGRLPIGCTPDSGEPLLLDQDPFTPNRPVQAVAAFMAPAHTVTYNSAYQTNDQDAPRLPLFAYAAVGWHDERFWAAGFRSDGDIRQDPDQFDQLQIERHTNKRLKQNRDNRLIQHLGKCCLTYGCPAARNYFLGRWEAPIPTSPHCNARCVGCISLQSSGCCPSTQDRITFSPTPAEIAEMAVAHLESAPRPIVSFGQGCEGEPLLEAETIEKAISLIRRQTGRGTVNLNSNSSLPEAVDRLAAAGLDSLRVSLNSAQEPFHQRYYRPKNFSFGDVKESIRNMKKRDKFVSLNYFILPGLTDSVEEYEALSTLIDETRPDFIQLRNLNMDPEWYLEVIKFSSDHSPISIRRWLKRLKKRFPWLGFGYFNPYLAG
ncbi:MAG: radical SAM protein [Thermodesulfobacteriota bacterium]